MSDPDLAEDGLTRVGLNGGDFAVALNGGDLTSWPQPLVPRQDLRRIDQMVTDEWGFHPIDEPDPHAGAARHRPRHLCQGWLHDGKDRPCREPAVFFERDEQFVDRLCGSCWGELTPASRDRYAARPPGPSSRIFGTSDWRSGEIAFWRTGLRGEDGWEDVIVVGDVRALPDADFARVRWTTGSGSIGHILALARAGVAGRHQEARDVRAGDFLWVTGADLRRATELVRSERGFHLRGEATDPTREATALAESRRSGTPCDVRGGTCADAALFFLRAPNVSSCRTHFANRACMPCWQAMSQIARDLYAARAPRLVSDQASDPNARRPHPRYWYACRAQGRQCMGSSTHFARDDRATHGHVCAACWLDLPREERDLYQDSDRAPVVDGLSPLDCRVRWGKNRDRVEAGLAPMFPLTEAQVAEGRRSQELIGDLHARALRDRVRAQAQRERDRVRVDLEFEPWD